MQMVTTSLNKCGSEMQQKAMASAAIEKEITEKMKEVNIYNKIYQWRESLFSILKNRPSPITRPITVRGFG